MPDQPKVVMSLREYARRRQVSAMAVSDACKAGRLVKSIARDPETGRVAGITDPVLADLEWAANTDVTKAPPKEQARAAERAPAIAKLREAMGDPTIDAPPEGDGELSSLQQANLQDKFYAAQLRKLKYLQAAGKLVPAADVEREVRDMIVHCKTRLLGIPSAVKQELSDLTPEHMALMELKIREALEDLAAPSLVQELTPEPETELEPCAKCGTLRVDGLKCTTCGDGSELEE